ncbi:MAG: hypothetical protein JF607_00595 [Burkholderiales bacterium]|jgi:hypothetical protein|nr:hypothetical protein [Burkholderiales bacterium]
MDALRWILLVAIGAAAAAALWQSLSAPPARPAAEAEVIAVAPVPSKLPEAASAMVAAPAASPAARRTVAPLPATRPAAPRIGAEGYGPHIDRALTGDDAAAAWEAVRWLRLCASNEARRSSLETARNQGISPEMMTQMMVEADAEARRCQTVTVQHRAMLPELASRAMRAGVPEAVSAYSGAVFAADLTPAQRQQAADAMRRDARSGNAASLLGALTAHESWGLSDAEKLAYLAAYISLPGHPEAKALLDQCGIRFKRPPTPEQQAAASRAGQEIVERMLTNGQPDQHDTREMTCPSIVQY